LHIVRLNDDNEVQSRFAETLTLTLNHNFGESGFGESERHRQWCKTNSWWQTVPEIYNTFSIKILPHTTGTSRLKQFMAMVGLKSKKSLKFTQTKPKTIL